MLLPRLFANDFFEDTLTPRMYGHLYQGSDLMRTDVKETDTSYEMHVELPGFRKEDIALTLKDGYLTIRASKNVEQLDNGHYVRRERYSGVCERSFYVGDQVRQEDVHARFQDGVLQLTFPKPGQQPAVEQVHHIAIEG